MFLAKKVEPLVAAPMADISCASFAQRGCIRIPLSRGLLSLFLRRGTVWILEIIGPFLICQHSPKFWKTAFLCEL